MVRNPDIADRDRHYSNGLFVKAGQSKRDAEQAFHLKCRKEQRAREFAQVCDHELSHLVINLAMSGCGVDSIHEQVDEARSILRQVWNDNEDALDADLRFIGGDGA